MTHEEKENCIICGKNLENNTHLFYMDGAVFCDEACMYDQIRKLEAENAELKRCDDWNEVYQKKMDELEAVEKVSDARWEENEALKKRVEELEQRMVDQANMIFEKLKENKKLTDENEAIKKRCDGFEETLEDIKKWDLEKMEALAKATSLCKTLAEALEGLMEVEPEHCACGDMNCNDPKIRWDKAKLALEQYNEIKGGGVRG